MPSNMKEIRAFINSPELSRWRYTSTSVQR
jgi:hypothetical protein